MDKKYNTEFGTHIDLKLLHRSSEVFPKLVFTQEPKSFISELLLEQPFHTFPILSDLKDLSTLSNSPTESAEI